MTNIQIPKNYYDYNDSTNKCLLCRQPDYTLFRVNYSFGFPITFSKCRCGIIKQTPMPNQYFFEWFFNSDLFFSSKKTGSENIWGFYDYFTDENCRLATSRLRYKKLHSIFSSGHSLNIMKIGPSTGTFLYIANTHGHNAIGCDISSKFIEYANTKYKVRIDHGRFEKLNYCDEQFDVIMLLNVIENIPNLDDFLKCVRRTLKKDGYFIINFIDMKNNIIEIFQKEKYFLYRPPVCYIFEDQVINKTIEKYGFKIKMNYLDIRYLHLEKIITLLGWKYMLNMIKFINIHRIPFPIYAYPSKIKIFQKLL